LKEVHPGSKLNDYHWVNLLSDGDYTRRWLEGREAVVAYLKKL